MSISSFIQRLTGVTTAVLLALVLMSAAQAQAAEAPRGTKAVKPQLVPAKAKKGKPRPRPAVSNKDGMVVIGGPSGMLGVGRGCTAPALQNGGWYYRWCGVDWETAFSFNRPVLLEYQHQWYNGRNWVGYVSTWCQPGGGCVYMAPNNTDQPYHFFYQ